MRVVVRRADGIDFHDGIRTIRAENAVGDLMHRAIPARCRDAWETGFRCLKSQFFAVAWTFRGAKNGRRPQHFAQPNEARVGTVAAGPRIKDHTNVRPSHAPTSFVARTSCPV